MWISLQMVSACSTPINMLSILVTRASLDPSIFVRGWPESRIGSLSNGNGDVNESGKKAIGLDWRNNNFARASRFLYFSLLSMHDYDKKLRNFTFCEGRELRYSPLEFNSWKIANIWHIKGLGIRTMKFETARIPILGDVFAAVACRRCLSSLMSPLFMSITWRIVFLVHERCHENIISV